MGGREIYEMKLFDNVWNCASNTKRCIEQDQGNYAIDAACFAITRILTLKCTIACLPYLK